MKDINIITWPIYFRRMYYPFIFSDFPVLCNFPTTKIHQLLAKFLVPDYFKIWWRTLQLTNVLEKKNGITNLIMADFFEVLIPFDIDHTILQINKIWLHHCRYVNLRTLKCSVVCSIVVFLLTFDKENNILKSFKKLC